MKLMTKTIEKKLSKYPLGSQDGKGDNAICVCKFFNPFGAGTWLVTEGEQQEDGDWLFFGKAHIFEWEWGYFTLKELLKIRVTSGPFVLGGVERDICCDGKSTVREMLNW